jgi:CHAT domain
LRTVLTRAIASQHDKWENKADIIFKAVRTTKEFIDTLNAFDGYIMTFDGHGVDNANEPVGKLIIGREAVDVWELRKKVRVPPIAILSACDTHGIDASSQATVGNGFLAIGARTVLATLLPVGGIASVIFVTRLVHRIADFLPAALRSMERTLNWAEVIAGMLRMLFVSEILNALIPHGVIEDPIHSDIQLQANMDINTGDARWFENLTERIAGHRGETPAAASEHIQKVIARSEAVRYVQLGNPETLLVSSDELHLDVMHEYDDANASYEARMKSLT